MMTEKERVGQHLDTLSILWYVWAAIHLLGVCGGGLYVAIGAFATAEARRNPNAPEGAEVVGPLLAVVGGLVIVFFLIGAICSFLSARWIKQRRHRTFSQVVAGFACLNIPLGTALGIATFIVLGKPEAEELYAGIPDRPPPPLS